MRYARNIRKSAIARRIVLSWVVVAVIFLIIGFCFGVMAGRAGAEGGGFMTKAELETKIVLLERRIAEQERKAGLLCDALRRIVDLSEDDLPDAELKEAIDHGLSVYPLIAGRMRAIADRALDSFSHGGQLRELVGMGKEVRR